MMYGGVEVYLHTFLNLKKRDKRDAYMLSSTHDHDTKTVHYRKGETKEKHKSVCRI
jgi:hypothetical protein